MSANVETMFYVRQKPWHGLGTEVQEAPTSADALIWAGLDWEVVQKDVYTEYGSIIPGYKANTRSTDEAILGIVSNRYKKRWKVRRIQQGQHYENTQCPFVHAENRS